MRKLRGKRFLGIVHTCCLQYVCFSSRRRHTIWTGDWSSDVCSSDLNGNWLPLAQLKNVSADIAPTAGQMPRALGLALASKLFREEKELNKMTELTDNGNEICFCTIGDASTSEGHFWETMNAAGVLQVPLAVFVWDDGYGISVPKEYQTTKSSISKALAGLQKTESSNGIDI